MRERKIGRRWFHSGRVILSHIHRAPGAIVFHEQRTTIDFEMRAEFPNRRLIDLMTIERAANRLRDAMRHRLALRLLGQVRLALAQRFLRMLALREVTPDALDADRFTVAKHQASADF